MTNLTITIDSAQVEASLAHIAHKLDHMQPVMTAIAHDITENVRLTFKTQSTPYGVPWAKNSPVTIARYVSRFSKTTKAGGTLLSRKGEKLWDTKQVLLDKGLLANSIAYQASDFAAEIGVNASVKYAAMMNFGGTKAQFGHLWGDIPKRQFMPSGQLPADWEAQLIRTVNDYLGIV